VQAFPKIPTLEEAAADEALVESALAAFFNLAEAWRLSEEERCRLLGGIAKSTLYAWQRTPRRVLGTDTLTRISLLLGIHVALVRLFPNAPAGRMAERVRQPLQLPLTLGRSILDHLLRGGIPAMADARRFFEAEAGGGSGIGFGAGTAGEPDAARRVKRGTGRRASAS
jgi:hypothetical protein